MEVGWINSVVDKTNTDAGDGFEFSGAIATGWDGCVVVRRSCASRHRAGRIDCA